jgi:3',5'-cyclic AMP phosphodiesterase CpdA
MILDNVAILAQIPPRILDVVPHAWRGASMPLRIGLVTDIHHGPDVDVRVGSAAPALLSEFTRRMREDFHPDLIVDMGDRINDTDPKADKARLAEVRHMLEAASAPILYAWGNHDLINVPRAEGRAILGKRGDFETRDAGGYHLVVLNSQDPTIDQIGGTLSDNQLDWLEDDLKDGTSPTLVFCHHPLDEQDPSRHWYFRHHHDHALCRNRTRARDVLAASGRVKAVFNGHMHLNTVEVIDGIPYVTLMSLVDSGITTGPSGCYAEITASDGGGVEVKILGQLSLAVAFR